MRGFRFLFFWFYLFISLVGFAQSPDYSTMESDKQIAFSSMDYMEFVGHDDTSYYVIKHQQSRYKIQRLNSELNPVHEEFISEWQNRKSYNLEYAVHFHNTIYVFFSRRGIFNNALYVQTIDKNTLLQDSDLEEIVFVEDIKGNYADFHFALSRDETKLLVASRIKLNLKNTQFNEFYVYGEGLNPVWDRKDIYEFERKGPRQNKYLVDDFGNVSILSLIRQSSLFTIASPIKDVYKIFRYTNNGTVFQEYPVLFENTYIRDIDIVADKEGGLVCVGLYSHLFPNGIRGSFFMRINARSGMTGQPKFHAFDKYMLEQLDASKYYREAVIDNAELTSYYITGLLVRADGDIILITEQFYDQNFNTFNNLIITRFSRDGYLNWQNVIRKRQDYPVNYLLTPELTTIGKEVYDIESYNYSPPIPKNLCSYALIAPLESKDIVILFNDHIKNLDNNSKPKNFNNRKKSFLTAVHVSADGRMTDIAVRKAKGRRGVYPQPLDYYDKKNNEIIIPMYWGRRYKYLRVEFDI
ncbi:MAG: hypothetical protein ACOC10_08600 [Bacteroidota bacterium]